MAECFIYRTINTNADRIRAMSDEELGFLIRRGVCEEIDASQEHCETSTCEDCVMNWLQQPAEDVQHE